MQTILSMSKYIRNNLKLWGFGLFIPVFASLATNIFFADRLEKFSALLLEPEMSFPEIAAMLIVALIILLILSGIDDIGLYLFSLFAVTAENELKQDIFESMVHAPLKEIQRFHKGELVTRYNTDAAQCSGIVSYDVHGMIYQLLVGIGYLAAVLLYDLWIGLIMLVLGFGVILLNFLLLRRMIRIQKEILKAEEEYTLNCSNAIQGKMSIRQYPAKKMMADKIKASARLICQKEYQYVWLQTLKILTSDGLANICTYLLTPLACVFAVHGYISIPAVLFIHQICRYFIMYTQNLGTSFINYKTHELSYERISSVLSVPGEETDREKDRNTGRKAGFQFDSSISFEKVSVSYGERKVLDDVTFTIRPGEITCLAGESGSGKSTLIKTLLQMVDYEGRISVGDINCADIPLDILRSQIALSPEHGDLFNTTVYENIHFGDPGASEAEINVAAGKAAINGGTAFMQRDAGENGSQLSGGQRQRVSVARAMLKNAPVIILDEPTAALDAVSEAKLLDTLRSLKQEGKCILMISHKESTLRAADRLLYLEKGKVTEKSQP